LAVISDVQRIGAAWAFVSLPLQPFLDDSFGTLGDIGHRAGQVAGVGKWQFTAGRGRC
jgi:hypothetical protein